MSALEDLITANRENQPPELQAARAQLPDADATSELKADADRMARLDELAELKEGESIADVAVRGANVTFQVEDSDGVLAPGFFPLADLSKSKRSRSSKGAVQEQPGAGVVRTRGGSVPHGTASTDGDTDEAASGAPDPEATAEGNAGLPGNIDELNAEDTASLLTDPPEGVDPAAVIAHERQRENPRVKVERAAARLNL